jgi:hypothetical protein
MFYYGPEIKTVLSPNVLDYNDNNAIKLDDLVAVERPLIGLLNSELLTSNGILKSIEFYAIKRGSFELIATEYDRSVCGIEASISCAKFRMDSYTVDKGKEKSLFSVDSVEAGYHLYNNLSIPLADANLFILNSTIIGIYNKQSALYPEIYWEYNDARFVYCELCEKPLMNAPAFIRFGVEYADAGTSVYLFSKNYSSLGLHTIIAKTVTNPSIQDSKTVQIGELIFCLY